MNINKIPVEGKWNDIARSVNSNFTEIKSQLEGIETDTTLAMGMFATLEDLREKYSNPKTGSWAYIGTTLPAAIYEYKSGDWVNTGRTGSFDVDLNDYSSSEEISDARVILDDYTR